MPKNAFFMWDQQCQEALESIKAYLAKPFVLGRPIK